MTVKISADSHQITHSQQYSPPTKRMVVLKINMGNGFFFVVNHYSSGLDFYSLDNLSDLALFNLINCYYDWLVVSESGHFRWKPTCWKKCIFLMGKAPKTLDQFPAVFRRKGLLSYLLSGKRLQKWIPQKNLPGIKSVFGIFDGAWKVDFLMFCSFFRSIVVTMLLKKGEKQPKDVSFLGPAKNSRIPAENF